MSAVALLLAAAASVQAAIVRAAPLPEITLPAQQAQQPTAPAIQPPAIQPPARAPAPGPTRGDASPLPAGPRVEPGAQPTGPSLPATSAGPRRLDPALERDLQRLRRVAEPKSGFGTTQAAANAAWTLGLVELHAGGGPAARAQAQIWFERAARYGRQPLAYAGLAWCYIDGCQGPPDPSAAQQAITRLRPYHRGRALYLQWLLDTRMQPIGVRPSGPEGVNSLLLPRHDLLESAAAAGDTQARIELGLEAVVNGDLAAARSYLQAAAPRSRAAAADLELLKLQETRAAAQAAAPTTEAEQLFERARRAHRGIGAPANYAEALRLYQAAAAKGSVPARRMLGLITSRPQPDGTINLAWMAQLAWLDTSSSLPQLDSRMLASMMYRDPTPLFDLLPATWQRALSTVPR